MFGNFRRTASRFANDRSGNVAMMFGFAIIPVFFVTGIAVDYGRAAAARSAMQSAADAAALMASKDAAKLSAADLKINAEKYFKAILDRPDITGLNVNAVYSTASAGGQTLTLEASANVPNDFMSMAFLGGKPNTPVASSSTVRWGARYRVALALDNTGSMDSKNKMDELIKAAKKLIEDFAAMAKTSEDIYISVVPFNEDVNVGTDNKNADWLSWNLMGDACFNTQSGNKISGLKNKSDCLKNPNGDWRVDNASWTGCVTDRDVKHVGDHDQKGTLPVASKPETLFDAENYPECPVAMLGMTSVYSQKQKLLDKIGSMKPVGMTNQTIGLQWAWMTHLVGQGPFPAPSKDATMEYKDVIIMLTDGDNTKNRWKTCSTSSNAKCPEIDNRQAAICNNIKTTTKIEIYTVQVATDGDAIQPVAKNCASKPDDPAYFSYITNATQISTKFKNIFESIARLRVSA